MVSPPHNSELNPAQQRRIFSHLSHADKLLSDIEEILNAASSKSPFPRFRPDVDLPERKIVQDYLARIRGQMLRVLDGAGIQPAEPELSGRHSIRVTLAFVRVALQEITPAYLVGYGGVPELLVPELEGLSSELQGLVNKLDAFLARGPGDGIEQKLATLGDATDDARVARELGRIITAHGLVELRMPLSILVNRLGASRFEIAVFGQVSSGKSSLLNHIVGAEILPVGVNPITAVPTRLVRGAEASVTVSLAGQKPVKYDLARLSEFGTERGNPGNKKAVTGIVVEYPADRLPAGVALVDTPGLGSLATAGALESLAYLPQCDLGVVLINATATLTDEDVATIRTLRVAGIPALAVLSKADLLGRGDREAAVAYTRQEIRAAAGETIPVDPVSVVGPGEQLLDAWLERRILPLYENSRQLGAASLHRKLVALQESVTAALRVRVAHEGTQAPRVARWKECERGLRAAEGSIAETERRCLRAVDQAGTPAREALERASAILVERWRENEPAAVRLSVIRQAVNDRAATAAGLLREQMESLATKLQEALRLASAELRVDDSSGQGDLHSALRGIPRIDLDLAAIELPRPFSVFLPSALARPWLTAKLKQTAGPVVDDAFAAYSKVLAAWVRRTAADLQDRLDGHADVYRAQLDRLISKSTVTAEERETIERDLRVLATLSRPATTQHP